jgi:hypothetical protein
MDLTADTGFRRSPFWAFILLALVAAQGAVTLRLFGPGPLPDQLTNDDPVLDGRHPLHAYHGLLGNRVWHDRRGTTCFDPAFQAGYLKTPVFDAGSRPAELFYLIGGSSPRTYKTGLAVCCLLVPVGFALAGRGVGLGPGGSCLTALVGSVLWWSPAGRALIAAGDFDLLVGGLCAPIYLAWLGRYGRTPGPVEWLVLAATAGGGWYMQPLLMLVLVPVSLLYQCWAFRSVRFAWHFGLIAANAVGPGVNAFWLYDWAQHVWMYVPYGGADAPLGSWPAAGHGWEAFLPSDPVDLVVAALGVLGLLLMLPRAGAGAGLLTVGAGLLVVAGGAGRLWPIAAEFGCHRAATVALWCLTVSASYALAAVAGGIGTASGFRPLGLVWLGLGLVGLNYGLDLPRRWTVEPLEIGLGPNREDIVRVVREKSTAEGRILWEDRSDAGNQAGWTALLPELTHRPFLGGLSPDVSIDHMQLRLADGRLVHRPIAEWTDQELESFFERYNVVRVVARTPESATRFRKLRGASVVAEFVGGAGTMFALDRRPMYVLRGHARVTQLDWKRVALEDVEPDEHGFVVLSLHHHPGWRVTPDYVSVERDVDVQDPIPMIRLKLPGPVSRLTMSWRGE